MKLMRAHIAGSHHLGRISDVTETNKPQVKFPPLSPVRRLGARVGRPKFEPPLAAAPTSVDVKERNKPKVEISRP
jgi:hypothetical protein